MPVPDGPGTYAWTTRTSGVMSSAERRRVVAAIIGRAVGYLPGLIACAEQGLLVMRHSCRTWACGRALALLDDQHLDSEQFYVACLLHDYGLEIRGAGEDFTLRSAERASQCLRAVTDSEPAVRARPR